MKKCMYRCLMAAVLLLVLTTASMAMDVTPISADKAQEIIKKTPKIVILDIRTPNEYQSGHIQNAWNIDFFGRDFKERLEGLNKDATYLVYCRSGRRSNVTIQYLQKVGFKTIYHLTDGIEEWQDSGYPLVQ